MNNVALVILDGIGIGSKDEGDLVWNASTPTLDFLLSQYPSCTLAAHGKAVGLPTDDDMGNSEVGHNALGCGQIYSQGAKLVNESIISEKMFSSKVWKDLIQNCVDNCSTLHFIGLLSDGNVHSNIYHLIAMLHRAKKCGVTKCRVHILLDGRDVPSQSALKYIDILESEFKQLNSKSFDACIASGGGRMCITMDRYQADWGMVKLGWDTHVNGQGRFFDNASTAIKVYREEGYLSDQYLPPFVIVNNSEPVGKIVDNDSVILFNFRGDRALELSMAFEMDEFPYFDRKNKPNVKYAGMLQYDGDLHIPRKYLVDPPEIKNTLTEILVNNRMKEYAVSETQKYGHVTYFWNGNRSEKISEEYEEYEEIYSDNIPFEQCPWMKVREIADKFICAIKSQKYRFLRCNFPNGDMVGHTGNILATKIAVESVDLQLSRIVEICKETDTILLIVADHGNADKMFDKTKEGNIILRTAHSLNPVPFIICTKNTNIKVKQGKFGLANVAPTILDLLQLEIPQDWEESVIIKDNRDNLIF